MKSFQERRAESAAAGPGTPLGKIRSRQAEGLEKVSRKV